MHHVFISYSRRDFPQVRPLVDQLRDQGCEVWLDQTDIPVSVPWLDEIEEAIRGAIVVCICDSAHWRSSENCAIEDQLATDHGKAIVRWNLVDEDHRSAAHRIVGTRAERDPADYLACDLLTSSFRWSKYGKTAAGLATGRRLKALVKLGRLGRTTLDRAAREYLQASMRRRRRRRTFTIAGSLLTAITLLTIQVATGTQREVERRFQASTAQVAAGVNGDLALEHNVYFGMAQAVDSTGALPEKFASRQLLGQALAEVVPIRAKRGPAPAVRSTTSISAISAYTRHVATAGATRPTVTITDHRGRLVRRLATVGTITALAWSSSGRYLAVACGDGATVYDTGNAAVVWRLRGVPGAVVQLAWSDRDRHVVGTTSDGLQVEWNTVQARVASRVPDAWFMDLAAQTSSPKMAAVSRDGRVFGFDGRTGMLEWSTSRVASGFSTAVSRGPRAAWLVARQQDSASRLDLLSASGDLEHSMAIPDCKAGDVDYSEESQAAVVACGRDVAVVVDLTGTWHSRRADLPLLDTAAVVTSGNTAIAGGGPGELVQLDLGTLKSTLVAYGTSLCFYSDHRLALTPNGQMLFNTGTDAANGCSFRFTKKEKAWKRNALMLPLTDAADESRAIAISPDGRTVALGFSDGTIRALDVDRFTSQTLRHDLGGEIRGLAYTPDGGSLAAITRDGDLAIYPTTNDQLTGAEERAELSSRLTNAIALGLYTPPR